MKKIIITTLTIALLTGCTVAAYIIEELVPVDMIAFNSGFTKEYVDTSFFSLLSYYRTGSYGEDLSIYIEGDGSEYQRKDLSDDPSPKDPLVFYLAIKDPHKNVAYIARPCQYINLNNEFNCKPDIWSKSRYHIDTVISINEAIDYIKGHTGAKNINLIGFSGGGTLAILVAAIRQDIKSIRTVSGNLNTLAFQEFNNLPPLYDNLNPIDYAHLVEHIPQQHLLGGQDKVIPAFIAKSFINKMDNPKCAVITKIDRAGHIKNWDQFWYKLIRTPIACS